MEAPRNTRQRTAVSDALNASSGFTSAQELHEKIRTAGLSVGLTTVYRALQGLAAIGDADVIIREDGEAAYRRCSGRHHHHLVCRDCGRTIEVEGPAVETWADAVSAEHGFSEVSHTLEIFGRCSECVSEQG